MSQPTPASQKFIPVTLSAEGALEALCAVEPAWRWKLLGTTPTQVLLVGHLGNYTLTLTSHCDKSFWAARMYHDHLDIWGLETSGEIANTLAECALAAVEELAENLIADEFTAVRTATRSTDAAA